MRWGLVPAWFKEDDPRKMHYSTSNCRGENILQKKTYKVHTFHRLQGCKLFSACFLYRGSEDARVSLITLFLFSPQRSPWRKDSGASSWLMVFMSGRSWKKASSLSSSTSLSLRDLVRRKQRFRMTPQSQLAKGRNWRQRAQQRWPLLTWQTMYYVVFFF